MSEQFPLSGLRILVVEDVYLLAADLADQLSDFGCEVIGPAPSVERALGKIEGVDLDGAVLDVNLGEERNSFPLAKLLASRGIPFLFLTGYDSATIIPAEFQQVCRLFKPVDIKALAEALSMFRA